MFPNEKSKDNKGLIRSCKPKKDWQYNDQSKKKKTNNDLQNTKEKTKYRATRTPQKKRGLIQVLWNVKAVPAPLD